MNKRGWGNLPPHFFMFASDLVSKLRRIDPYFSLDVQHKVGSDEGSAGLYHDGNFVCGCPLGSMPDRSLMDNHGRIIVRGWQDILDILLKKKLITNSKSYKYFRYYR